MTSSRSYRLDLYFIIPESPAQVKAFCRHLWAFLETKSTFQDVRPILLASNEDY